MTVEEENTTKFIFTIRKSLHVNTYSAMMQAFQDAQFAGTINGGDKYSDLRTEEWEVIIPLVGEEAATAIASFVRGLRQRYGVVWVECKAEIEF